MKVLKKLAIVFLSVMVVATLACSVACNKPTPPTGGGVETIDKATIKTDLVAAERYAAILTDNQLGVLLYDYLTK